MKILQIIPNLCVAGAEKICEQLSRELKQMGHQVVVVSLYSMETPLTENLKQQGIPIRFLGKKSGFDPKIIPKLRKLIKEENPDTIHAHLNALPYALASVSKRVVYTVHSMAEKDAGTLIRMLIRGAFKSGRVTPVALSEIVQESIEKVYRIDKSLVPVIYNGINLQNCIPKTDYSAGKNFCLLHVGRFSEVKNHIGMLAAFKIIHDKYPNTVLRLVGDGEKRQAVEAYIRENDLADAVELLGVQSNVYPILHEADVFIMPSFYEGISVALVEAMGTGLPIVASATGGTPDMITSGESGLLCSLDTQNIADCVEQYITDSNLRARHGQAAIQAAEKFSVSIMAEKYVAVYEQI